MKIIHLLQVAAIVSAGTAMPSTANPQRHRRSGDTKSGRQLMSQNSRVNPQGKLEDSELTKWNKAVEAKRAARKNKLNQRVTK